MKIYFDDTGNTELEGTFIELAAGLASMASLIAMRAYQNNFFDPDNIDDLIMKTVKNGLVYGRNALAKKYPDQFAYLKPKEKGEEA